MVAAFDSDRNVHCSGGEQHSTHLIQGISLKTSPTRLHISLWGVCENDQRKGLKQTFVDNLVTSQHAYALESLALSIISGHAQRYKKPAGLALASILKHPHPSLSAPTQSLRFTSSMCRWFAFISHNPVLLEDVLIDPPHAVGIWIV